MSGHLEDQDDFEIARRLRRAAGATPDVYVAYDTVLARVGTVRRRRRMAVTSTAGLALLFTATTYVLNLRTSDRTLKTASPSTEVTPPTTEPVYLGESSTVPVAIDGGTGPDGDAGGSTDAPTTTAAQLDTLPSVEPTVADTTPAVTAPTETAPLPTLPPTAPPATPKPPPSTKPPVVTQPPATVPPATVPPATEPPATTPPVTQPPVTDPPATTPPSTVPATEPTVPVPSVYVTGSADHEGNGIGVVFQNGQLSLMYSAPADGYVASPPSIISARKLKVTFQSASTTITIFATANGSKIEFQVDVVVVAPATTAPPTDAPAEVPATTPADPATTADPAGGAPTA